MSDYASQSGHFYRKDGTPCYEIDGKKTTLRELRKHDLVPSVTTIIACSSKPGLDVWKQDQTILACLTMPRIENEPEEAYIKRLKADAKSQSENAAARGTEIHGMIERGFRDGEENWFYLSAKMEIEKHLGVQSFLPEKSFAVELNRKWYGGKVDLHNEKCLIDIKTTDKDVKDLKLWDDHYMQLGAYDMGLRDSERECFILYVNSKTAESRLIQAKEKDINRGINMFLALLEYYYAKNGL